MNHYRFAGLTLAGFALALAVGPQAITSAAAAGHVSNYPSDRVAGDVEILVDDVAQPRYAHAGRWYVEAQKGREYAIRLRNPHPVRVAVALSVDGLNTIDARETTASEARKWVLGPFETATIRGWQTSQTDARRFEFTTEARSYGQALGKTNNLGVISAVFFRERAPVLRTDDARDYAPRAAAPPASPQDGRSARSAAQSEAAPDAPSERLAEAPSSAGSPTSPSAAPQDRLSARSEQDAAASANRAQKSRDEYAATGMGRRTDHRVEQVWLDLEDTPVHTVNIRYEFHPELVRLGILPRVPTVDSLQRREHARGFEPGFSPEPPYRR